VPAIINSVKKPKTKYTPDNTLPWLLLIGGIIVTLASIALSVEVFNRLKNPSFVPVCNLNPILSCTSVADSNQAHAFGMALGEVFGWPNLWQTTAAIILAFVFGYMLTFYGAIKRKMSRSKAVKTALATDTASITSMEVVDNAFIWVVPGAINATLSSFLFWWSLIVSLAVAFVLTVPVNRFILSHSNPHSDHH
jgi:uncharacterized membrane protein